jgi:predicted short-subunit dehydrogenase-like oxidoreductase (DUF2520 family)
MQVVLIGSGNVATILGKLIAAKEHSVLQVISNKLANAELLAKQIGATAADISNLTAKADIYIIAVKDHAVSVVAEKLKLPGKLVLHTSGTLTKDVLQKITDRFGVIWPLQTIRKETAYIPQIPFIVDGNTPAVTDEICEFAKSLNQPVYVADDEQRKKMHIAAVFTSNFVNHFYALAEDFCQKENLDFSLLIPIISETARRLQTHSPSVVQTGPAIRGDIVTIEKHLRILEAHPYLRKLYLRISNSIMQSPYK